MKFKLSLILFFAATVMFAQKSPRKQSEGTISGAKISVDYGSPSVKERTIWGDLVPYNKVWRAGANENTTITFDKEVNVGGEKVAAGTYGLFIFPSEGKTWEVALSSKNDAWGSKGYSADNDVARFKVTVKTVDANQEAMLFKVKEKGVKFAWEKARFLIPIK